MNSSRNTDNANSLEPQQRRRRKPPTYLRESERDQLLSIVTDPRDRAMLTLFCYSGLRLNELLMLDRTDIDFDERTVLVRFAKRGKWRKLRLHAAAMQAITDYLETRIDDEPALFISQRRQRFSHRGIQKLLDRYTYQLNWSKRVTPHCLRHTFATALLRQCRDIRIVQRALGHEDIATTSIYLHLEDDELYGAMDRL